MSQKHYNTVFMKTGSDQIPRSRTASQSAAFASLKVKLQKFKIPKRDSHTLVFLYLVYTSLTNLLKSILKFKFYSLKIQNSLIEYYREQ